MMILRGEILKVVSDDKVNQQTGEIKSRWSVAVKSSDKVDKYGQPVVYVLSLSDKQVSSGYHHQLQKLSGKTFDLPFYSMASAYKDKVYMRHYIDSDFFIKTLAVKAA